MADRGARRKMVGRKGKGGSPGARRTGSDYVNFSQTGRRCCGDLTPTPGVRSSQPPRPVCEKFTWWLAVRRAAGDVPWRAAVRGRPEMVGHKGPPDGRWGGAPAGNRCRGAAPESAYSTPEVRLIVAGGGAKRSAPGAVLRVVPGGVKGENAKGWRQLNRRVGQTSKNQHIYIYIMTASLPALHFLRYTSCATVPALQGGGKPGGRPRRSPQNGRPQRQGGVPWRPTHGQ